MIQDRSQPTPQVQKLLDSAAAKVLQYVVTVVMLPLACYTGSQVLSKIERLSEQMAAMQTYSATTEIRLKTVEMQEAEERASITRLSDKILLHEFQLNDLQQKASKK